ncbi:CRISPR-associated endonuclease Cas3'' [Pelagicoccus sp. SDUM812002]|uniref:CRISPR-associated endonuclease Cas3'' n=1 Tax=Pelagicoccus sp. SDUM812002 TaxID=3041266 RepID=UPI00280EDEDA|nr:CRISPR-associated endonuclease Cas3'' [Pelagicoccus sp. SDUM812002]MDQ8187501.1 CRISPR-associated endonuclease Cas3'' [Pelagicoccus sp. SDUM812002]
MKESESTPPASEPCYAHTHPEFPRPKDAETHWEKLYTECSSGTCTGLDDCCSKCGHLDKVARLTAKFAEEMFPEGSEEANSAREWGWLAGLWHDLGKFAPEWQEYLKRKVSDAHQDECIGKVDHSTAGAQWAVSRNAMLGHLFAYAIAGHHSGLADSESESACLSKRLKKSVAPLGTIPDALARLDVPKLPPAVQRRFRDPLLPNASPVFALYSRMLFSCLVDADFLATESFMNPGQAKDRSKAPSSLIERMDQILTQHVEDFGVPNSSVNQARSAVHQQCLEAAENPVGLFTLTVPTGGGKTLSSLAFALRHAIRHRQRRVIYVIPFTSIIEQNAQVFAEVFDALSKELGIPIVLEHHSNLSPESETIQTRLASENWDAPIIVTTAVQFYESLHAARTSSCRKLHNIANCVVILDEAQCLPRDYLHPCLDVLQQLAAIYHTSVVLCTATQPAIKKSEAFPIGIGESLEIISDPQLLFEDLRRVRVINRGPLDDETVAGEMDAELQCLAIVNTRRHARELFNRLSSVGEAFHLSTLMCPIHRKSILREVRERLVMKKSVRLVSTQLIEAGVDVDFPRVYRSMAGIDSIGQAAGRCNRNGKLESLGETHLFASEHQRSESYFRETTNVTSQVLALNEDPLSLSSVEQFFQLYYHEHRPANGKRWDSKEILEDYRLNQDRSLPFGFQFREVAKKFRLIENDQTSIVIPYDGEAKALIEELRNEVIPLHRDLLRKLQSYVVQLRKTEFQKNHQQFERVRDGQFHILICPETHYSPHFGLHFENANQDLLICTE